MVTQMQKVGIDFSYRVELNRALKRLLREVIATKDKAMQLKNLGKVYAWHNAKLQLIGHGSQKDQDDDEMILNPGLIDEIQKRREEKNYVKRQRLMDQSLTDLKHKRMFEEEERTEHKDLPPAKFRLTDYKRNNLGKLFQQKIDEKTQSDMS